MTERAVTDLVKSLVPKILETSFLGIGLQVQKSVQVKQKAGSSSSNSHRSSSGAVDNKDGKDLAGVSIVI